MTNDLESYKLRIRIPCSSGGCWGTTYIQGKEVKISRPKLRRSPTYSGPGKIESDLEEMSVKDFEKLERKTDPSQWLVKMKYSQEQEELQEQYRNITILTEQSKEQEQFKGIYKKIIKINQSIREIKLEDLKQNKTIPLIEKAKNYLEIYKTKVPKKLKKEFEKKIKFDCKRLEELVEDVEGSIKKLNNS